MTDNGEDRREEILTAALDVFSEVGYQKATIKAIAKRAQLKSPALIYWYFDNKRDLLRAVLTRLALFIDESTDPAQFLDLPPDMVLTHLANLFFESADKPESRKLFRLFLSEAMHSPDMVDDIVQGGPMIVTNALLGYFTHQVETGGLKPHNPQSSTRAFIGMLIVYLMAHEVMTPVAEEFPPRHEYAQEIVRIFLEGLKA